MGIVYSYRGEDETLGPGVSYLDLLQGSHYCLHFCRVASLKGITRHEWNDRVPDMVMNNIKIIQATKYISLLFFFFLKNLCLSWRMALLTDLDWDVLVLTGWLCGEHVGDLCVGRGLPTNGTFNGPASWAHTVLLHNDSNALVTEAVAASQHCPLRKRERWHHDHKGRHWQGSKKKEIKTATSVWAVFFLLVNYSNVVALIHFHSVFR